MISDYVADCAFSEYVSDSSLPRSSFDLEYGEVYGACSGQVQGFLAGLKPAIVDVFKAPPSAGFFVAGLTSALRREADIKIGYVNAEFNGDKRPKPVIH